MIDCAGPYKDEDASIVALHYQHPPNGSLIWEEITRIAAANKYVRWTNVENLSFLGSGGIVHQLIEDHPDKDFWPGPIGSQRSGVKNWQSCDRRPRICHAGGMQDGRTKLTAVERDGAWTVRLDWPNGITRYFGSFRSKSETTTWIALNCWMTAPRIDERDMARRRARSAGSRRR